MEIERRFYPINRVLYGFEVPHSVSRPLKMAGELQAKICQDPKAEITRQIQSAKTKTIKI
jgi:hypothetical protein